MKIPSPLLRLLPVRWRMRLAWERRARKNAMHYIADFKDVWEDEAEFFQTGRDDVERFLAATDWGDTSGARLLEIGCGLGRMSRALAKRFGEVDAIDISPTMIERARDANDVIANLRFHVCNGVDLRGFPDAAFDFVISYIVFQHIPDPDVIYGYIREALRVLKPAGRFRFQARNDQRHARPNTYDGASIEIERVRSHAAAAGRNILNVEGEGTHYCYIEIG